MPNNMSDEKSSPKKIDVVLRDLDVLLRKKFGVSLIVDSFKTSSLVPPGENYGSSMLKVDAVVRRDGVNSEPEELFLIAKMAPPTELQSEIFDSPYTFPKEIFMFTDIIPAYKALEREYGIPEDQIFDVLPELYGARLSLDEAGDKFDHDAVILMENLKLKNYTCGDRRIGIDMEHTKLVIEALARFHALGIAMKFKKPEVFKGLRIRAKVGRINEKILTDMFESVIKDVEKIPALLPYLSRVRKLIRSDNAKFWISKSTEPWDTICHVDLWTNNFMFCHNVDGKPEDVKFVDFQVYTYQNALRDLIFFIFTSCRKEVLDKHVQDLIDFYYEKLTSLLARLDCDLSSFSRESFDKQLANAANDEFSHCATMIRVITADPRSHPDATNLERMRDVDYSDEFRQRMTENVKDTLNPHRSTEYCSNIAGIEL